jgi:hypothetical protein
MLHPGPGRNGQCHLQILELCPLPLQPAASLSGQSIGLCLVLLRNSREVRDRRGHMVPEGVQGNGHRLRPIPAQKLLHLGQTPFGEGQVQAHIPGVAFNGQQGVLPCGLDRVEGIPGQRIRGSHCHSSAGAQNHHKGKGGDPPQAPANRPCGRGEYRSCRPEAIPESNRPGAIRGYLGHQSYG